MPHHNKTPTIIISIPTTIPSQHYRDMVTATVLILAALFYTIGIYVSIRSILFPSPTTSPSSSSTLATTNRIAFDWYRPDRPYYNEDLQEYYDYVHVSEEDANISSFFPQDEKVLTFIRKMQFINRLQDYEMNLYSADGEDGVVEYIFNNILMPDSYVHVFSDNGNRGNNTRYLYELQGWEGREINMIGGSRDMNAILYETLQFTAPITIGLLSMEIHSVDYYVIRNVMEDPSIRKPLVVVQEVNPYWRADESFVIEPSEMDIDTPGNHNVSSPCSTYWGMSQLAAKRLYERYGYVMIYVSKSGTHAYFLSMEALEVIEIDSGIPLLTKQQMLHYVFPSYISVYRRTWPTTPCNQDPVDAFMQFRNIDIVEQMWLRVGLDGTIALPDAED